MKTCRTLLYTGGMILLTCIPTACAPPKSRYSYARFSPNGRTVAYLRADESAGIYLPIRDPLFGEFVILRLFSDYVCWFDIDTPASVRKARIPRSHSASNWGAPTAFSPDNRFVALVGRKSLYVLDMSAGRFRRIDPKSQNVQQVAWISEKEVVYSTGTPGDRILWDRDVSFYRERLDRPGGGSELIYREPQGYQQARMSPNGLYAAVCPRRAPSGQKVLPNRVVNLKKRKALGLGLPGGEMRSHAWRPDSSLLACVIAESFDRYQKATPEHLILIDPVKEKVLWRERLPSQLFQHLFWTADGEYLCLEVDSKRPDQDGQGLFLIRPERSEFLAFRNGEIPNSVASDDHSWWRIRSFPVPGWIQLRILYLREKAYAKNYRTGAIVPLWAGDRAPAIWAVSPDGSRAVAIDREGNITVRRVNLNQIDSGK